MKDKKIKAIREAVCANRGGLSEATDGQIMIIWNSLPPDVQKQYLDSITTPAPAPASQETAGVNRGGKKERKENDATGTRTK